jgi:hypothetical protein
MNGVGEAAAICSVFVAQLLIASAIKIIETKYFEVTQRFYRLSRTAEIKTAPCSRGESTLNGRVPNRTLPHRTGSRFVSAQI